MAAGTGPPEHDVDSYGEGFRKSGVIIYFVLTHV